MNPEPEYFQEASALSLNYEYWINFQNQIPRQLRIAVKRFKGNPIDLLRLLTTVPDFLNSKIEKNPGLLLYIATKFATWKTDEMPIEELLQLAKLPHTELLKRIKVAPKFDKLLAKIPPQHLSANCVQVLADALEQPVFGKTLTHLKNISPILLDLIECPQLWPIITPALIHDLTEKTVGKSGGLFDSQEAYVIILKRHLSKLNLNELPRLKSLDEVPQLLRSHGVKEYDEFLAKCGHTPAKKFVGYPSSPITINSVKIKKLNGYVELQNESRIQKNCTETHYEQILGGNCYFFKSTDLAPERLTIKISREGEEAPWLITDIRGFDNTEPCRSIIQWTVNELGLPASLDYWPNDAWYLPVGQKYSFVPIKIV
jgi:hypothetical protein